MRVVWPIAFIPVVQQVRQYQTADEYNEGADGQRNSKPIPEMAERDDKDSKRKTGCHINCPTDSSLGHCPLL